MQKTLQSQAKALSTRKLLNESYLQHSHELVRNQDSKLSELLAKVEGQVESRKLELARKYEHALQKFNTDTRIDLLNFERQISDRQADAKALYTTKHIEEMDANLSDRMQDIKQEFDQQANNVQELRVLIKNILNERGEVKRLEGEVKCKIKDLELTSGELDLVMAEYKRELKHSCVVDKENIDESNCGEMQRTIAELSKDLESKELELTKLKEATSNATNLENDLLKGIEDIKKKLSKSTVVKDFINAPSIISKSIPAASIEIPESDIANIKMKAIAAAITNEANDLEQRHQSLLKEYRHVVKLMKVIESNDAEWRKHFEKTSLWKLSTTEVQVGFIKQGMQLEHQLRLVMYCLRQAIGRGRAKWRRSLGKLGEYKGCCRSM